MATATVATVYSVQTVEGAVAPKSFGVVASGQATDGGNSRNPGNGNGLTANSQTHSPDFGADVSGLATNLAHNPP